MPAWKLTIEYDGTRYRGWQEQKNVRTIAGEVRTAGREFFKSDIELIGSGRTDAGVHALGQVAILKSGRSAGERELLHALNRRLPADINILNVEQTRQGFHPRHDAINRYYLYQISTRRSAFAKRYVWWVRDQLDYNKMRHASHALLGRHDFAAFCERVEGERSTLVVVNNVEMAVEGSLILFRIGASHFLWKMVRRIVGVLVEVGRGAFPVGDFKALLTSNTFEAGETFDVAAHTAPPSGLFLECVVFEKGEAVRPLKASFPVSGFHQAGPTTP